MAGHAETARVINDDQVGPAFLDELGADTGAGTGGNDGFLLVQRVL
jgi:hypothetical protein